MATPPRDDDQRDPDKLVRRRRGADVTSRKNVLSGAADTAAIVLQFLSPW